MASFIAYDLTFLIIFTLAVVLFLTTRRHNLKREGLLYLYRTRVGLRIIEWTSTRYRSLLKPAQLVIIASGYALMLTGLWVLARLSYLYLTSPTLAQDIRVPVLTPLVPYIDRLFAVDFLPPFYFTYWILIIAIVAVPHEFAHGIFARLNRVRIHSTGFGFLGPFLAAFVEQDDKDMNKAPKKAQLAILAAGTFANVLMTLLFALFLWIFFLAAFTPAGVYIGSYATTPLATADILTVNAIPLTDASSFIRETNETLVSLQTRADSTYYTTPEALRYSTEKNLGTVIVYDNTPAFGARLQGPILAVDSISVSNETQLRDAIQSHKPGDTITITTFDGKEAQLQAVTLAERSGRAFLGITTRPALERPRGALSGTLFSLYRYLDPVKYYYYTQGTYYHSDLGNFGLFLYDLLWWTVLINISVALANMIPVGIFDGGRFFYLTIWGMTGSKKAGEQAFKAATWIILALITLLMVKWVLVIF